MLRFNRVKKLKVKKKNYPDLNPRFYRQDKAVLKISWMLGRTSIDRKSTRLNSSHI